MQGQGNGQADDDPPLAAVGMAASASASGWGLLNHFQVPFWIAVPVAVMAMDFVIWLQHVMVPFRGAVEGYSINRRHWPEGGAG
jgi:hypothetical protein